MESNIQIQSTRESYGYAYFSANEVTHTNRKKYQRALVYIHATHIKLCTPVACEVSSPPIAPHSGELASSTCYEQSRSNTDDCSRQVMKDLVNRGNSKAVENVQSQRHIEKYPSLARSGKSVQVISFCMTREQNTPKRAKQREAAEPGNGSHD